MNGVGPLFLHATVMGLLSHPIKNRRVYLARPAGAGPAAVTVTPRTTTGRTVRPVLLADCGDAAAGRARPWHDADDAMMPDVLE